MRKVLAVIILGVGVVAASSFSRTSNGVATDSQQPAAVFEPDGKLKLPVGYRRRFSRAQFVPNCLTGTEIGASLSLIRNTRNLAGVVLLALRPSV